MSPGIVQDATYFDAQKERRKVERYERRAEEYQALMCAFREGVPNPVEAETALGLRLLKDIRGVANSVYFKAFEDLNSHKNQEWSANAEDFASESVSKIMQRVRAGKFQTGYNLLGFLPHVRSSAGRRAYKDLTRAQKEQPLFLRDEETGLHYEHPAIFDSHTAQVAPLPCEVVELLTVKQQCLLAALDAHGGDRGLTAAYFNVSRNTFNKWIERLVAVGAVENLRLTISNMLDPETALSLIHSLAASFLPLVTILPTIPLSEWPDNFDDLSAVASKGQSVCNRYHATVRHILKLWMSKEGKKAV